MGNRYGKNQKRKHRELIEKLLVDNIRLRAENGQLRNEVQYFITMDREIAQIMGTATAFRLLTDKVRTSNVEPNQMHLELFNRPMYAYTNQDGQLLNDVRITKHHLKRLFAHIQEDPAKYGAYIKVLVGNETEAAVFVDKDYLMRSGLTPRDTEYLARNITDQLTRYINTRYETERNVNHVNRKNTPSDSFLLG